jgi:hypothetical protein
MGSSACNLTQYIGANNLRVKFRCISALQPYYILP